MGTMIQRIVHGLRNWKRNTRRPSADVVSREFRFKYTCFKDLLTSNTELLDIITDIEEKLRGQRVFGMSYVQSQAARAVFHCMRMVKSLDDLSAHRYGSLFGVVDRIDAQIKSELGRRMVLPPSEWILPYSQVGRNMIDWGGGKNTNLGVLLNECDVEIPEGFAIGTNAYDAFLQSHELVDEINRLRMQIDPGDPSVINSVSEEIQRLIISNPLPDRLAQSILQAYDDMVDRLKKQGGLDKDVRPHVAVRSSAIGEDSELSYAGQYLSMLNVPRDKILEAYTFVVASLYTPRAISYRLNKGIRDEDIAMSAACLEMVESVASGVMYSRDPNDLIHDHVLISAVWGLGPYAVDGIVTPDSYLVSKEDDRRIVEKNISHKPVRLEANPAGGLREVPVEKEFQDRPCLSDYQIRTLASYGKRIEDHYNFPQDMEWALARDGRLLILQTRPLHLEEFAQKGGQQVPKIEGYTVLCEGGAVACPGVGCGVAFHVESESDLVDFPEGGVLVAKHSSPQFVIVMRKAQAIVAEAGSITGHMASLSREFGLPTVLAISSATKLIPSGIEITVDAYSGRVYQGRVPQLLALQRAQASPMANTPVYETLRRVADWIVPLDLVNPTAPNFTPENCKTLHDVMRYVHEYSYREMFQISDLLSDTSGGGALRLVGPIPLDLHVIDLGGGLSEGTRRARRVNVDEVLSVPFQALLNGMLHVGAQVNGPRPVDLGGFLSVMREQMLSPATMAERFGDRSYAIISDCYLNFSSRIGYHYSALDSFCSEFVNKNYITFSFKGGAADDVRRHRRARSIAAVLRALEFSVEVREDRVDARYYRYEQELIQQKLDALGRLLQFTRQMDMLMASEASVDALATSFLEGNYSLDQSLFESLQSGGTETDHGSKRKPNPEKDAESSV